jgi:peptidyl-dipeptidase Dcp
MLADCSYSSLSGTSVYWDFVELPSQVMENWAIEKEFLDMFAVHYKTGEKMPQELVQKIMQHYM